MRRLPCSLRSTQTNTEETYGGHTSLTMQFDETELLLAREFSSLSLQERNKVIESIHGVDDIVKETPHLIVKKLRDFQKALDKLLLSNAEQSNITVATRKAYEEAQRQSKTYVQSRSFRLMFLRAESFEPSLAAQRMLIHLEEKLSRFGPQALTRPLTIKDLSPQSRAMLVDLGIHQWLPTRDSVGRAVYLIHADDGPRDLIRQDPMAAVSSTKLLETGVYRTPDSLSLSCSVVSCSKKDKFELLHGFCCSRRRRNTETWHRESPSYFNISVVGRYGSDS